MNTTIRRTMILGHVRVDSLPYACRLRRVEYLLTKKRKKFVELGNVQCELCLETIRVYEGPSEPRLCAKCNKIKL